MSTADIVTIFVTLFGTGGTAWFSVKHSLNGTKEDVRKIREQMATKNDVKRTDLRLLRLKRSFDAHIAAAEHEP